MQKNQQETILSMSYGETLLLRKEAVSQEMDRAKQPKLLEQFSIFFGFFSKVLVILSVISMGFTISKELNSNSVVLEPIGVPQRLVTMGVTQEVATQRIWDSLLDIGDDIDTIRGHTLFIPNVRQIDIAEPNSGLSIRDAVDWVRSILDIPQTRITGEFVCIDIDCSVEKIGLRVRAIRGANVATVDTEMIGESDGVGGLIDFHDAALNILSLVDPYVLSLYHYENREYEKSLEIAEGSIGHESTDPEWVHLLIGYNLLGLKRYREALVQFETAISIDDGFFAAHFNSGIANFHLHQHPEAIKSFSRASELDETNPDPISSMCTVFRYARSQEESAQCFYRALDLAPNHIHSLSGLVEILEEQNQPEAALSVYLRLAAAVPANVNFQIKAALLYRETGQNQEALSILRDVLRVAPENIEALDEAARNSRVLEQYEEATFFYSRIIATAPNRTDVFQKWSTALDKIVIGDEAGCRRFHFLVQSFRVSARENGAQEQYEKQFQNENC